MGAMFFRSESRKFKEHPRFAGVRIAMLVAEGKSDMVSVSELIIDPGVDAPVHTHDNLADSIFVVSGRAEALVNGEWVPAGPGDYLFVPSGVEHGIRNTGDSPLKLFIHHSPPMY